MPTVQESPVLRISGLLTTMSLTGDDDSQPLEGKPAAREPV